MKHSDFRIGLEFTMSDARWRCTDVGTRTVLAIKLDHDDDPSWYRGPPYALQEVVIDECDFAACELAEGPSTGEDDSEEQRRRHTDVVRFLERELRRFGVERVEFEQGRVVLSTRNHERGGELDRIDAATFHEALTETERRWRRA